MTCVVVELRRPRRPRGWEMLAAALVLLALLARPTPPLVETPATTRRRGGRKQRA